MQTPLKGAYVLHFILVVYKAQKRGVQTWLPATTSGLLWNDGPSESSSL